jgi:hypothetical protein
LYPSYHKHTILVGCHIQAFYRHFSKTYDFTGEIPKVVIILGKEQPANPLKQTDELRKITPRRHIPNDSFL